jgi:L-histidine N-alpha-methyltransferase
MTAPARMRVQSVIGASPADFAADVHAGLARPGQKELPSKYLYDDIGSALFEVICLLPEYGLSRAGQRLLKRYSGDLARRLPKPVVVAELGSGSGKKTRWVLESLARYQAVNYYPIDISRMALDRCAQELGHLHSVSVVGFERAYLDGLLEVAARRRPGEHLFVLFLGSTIGNFDRFAGEHFLGEVRSVLQKNDALLLSTDLEKSIPQTMLAYDDPTGVTAAFNLNLLARINRELGADFHLARFQHVVRYDEGERRIEMHLRSTVAQTVTIPLADCTIAFQEGETIWTESSHKYNREEVVAMGERAGYRCEAQWVDSEWPFAESLLLAQ